MKQRLLDLIAQNGPLSLAQFMSEALYHPTEGYYTTRVALGADGDFITAPEASQMFGEMVGLWAAQAWIEMGGPARVNLIELGPGSGAMMSDMLRAAKVMPAFQKALRVGLVETSAPLRSRQAHTLEGCGHDCTWFESLEHAFNGPSIIVGNEFIDCMPIRQFVRVQNSWRERVVGAREGRLVFGLVNDPLPSDALIPPPLRAAGDGAVAEIRPALPAFVNALAQRFKIDQGRALFFDYGAARTTGGDTFQALRAHASADPLDAPGLADLTAHVDFAELKRIAEAFDLDVAGPVTQQAWLNALGIQQRAAALQRAQPDQALRIGRQLNRLTAPDQMGELFHVICLSSPNLPPAFGFGEQKLSA